MNESSAPGAASGPRAHDIGFRGLVVVAAESDDIRIRGVDGSEARVVAPADGAGLETVAGPGHFTVRTLREGGRPGFVGIQIGRRGFGFPFGSGSSGTIELEVPRDARVEVHTSSGDVALRDVLGGVGVKTASGDVSLKRVARSVAVEAASGDVHVSAVEPVSLTARTVSGNVGARAPRFEHVAIETVSGDAELAGAFAPGPVHAISTVSGDVDLAVAGGLTLEVKTISGDVDCSHPDRRSGDGRRHPLVVGDGAARFAVRSMSGDVDVRAARRAAPEGEDTGRESAGPSGVEGFAPPLQVVPPPVSAPGPATTPATLAILEALARGEIDVVEAERRLAAGEAPAADLETAQAAEPGPATEPGPAAAPVTDATPGQGPGQEAEPGSAAEGVPNA